MMTRRELLWAGAAGLASTAIRSTAAQPAGVGVELYTVRDLLPKDADGTLRSIAEIGYHSAEGDRNLLLQLSPLLKKHGLATPSCMIETPLITGKWDEYMKANPGMKRVEWNQALDSVHTLGARFAVLPYLQRFERGTDADSRKRLADQMNAAGERCRKAGLTFCYHNHAFEFEGQPGERLIDVLEQRLDPKAVSFEVDVFWVSMAGLDPVEFLDRNAGRVALVHLKDKQPGSPVQYNESAVKPAAFMEVGSGALKFPAILKAAAKAGAQWYHVEQDRTPGNPLDSLRKSYDYLRSLHAPEITL